MRLKLASSVLLLYGLTWTWAAEPAAAGDTEFVFSAPPRGEQAKEQGIYDPIAEYLTRATGQKFVYAYSHDWLTYQNRMRTGTYDLMFDGPHFVGWRMANLGHTPLVKLADEFVFVVIARADNQRVKEVKDLAGRMVCAHSIPNLGTLALLSQFPNAARQPYITEIQGWDKAYQGVQDNKCVGTVLPLKVLKKMDSGASRKMKTLYTHPALPNQAFTASPRVSAELQRKIAAALLSEEGKKATAKLLEAYAAKEFVPARPGEYAGLGSLLKDVYGFDNDRAKQTLSAKDR